MTTATAQRLEDGKAWTLWLESGQWERAPDGAGAMLPALAVEIVRLAQDPDVAPNQITQVVSKDPVLAAHVVRLANSAASASVMTITSLSEAVVRVGTQVRRADRGSPGRHWGSRARALGVCASHSNPSGLPSRSSARWRRASLQR